jgi:cysteine synthase B
MSSALKIEARTKSDVGKKGRLIQKPNLIGFVGNTPLIRLDGLIENYRSPVEIYGKAEWYNPGGSVKDRPASAIIEAALTSGALDRDRVLLDSTSGNMGIAYATLGASLQIPIHLAIPENAGVERLSRLSALGAELTLTDPLEGSDGARLVAMEMANSNPQRYFFADQYSNDANWLAHYGTTGPEIVRQTEGRITHFIAGLGTSGTLMGTGRYLQEFNKDIRLIAVQPDNPFHGLDGLKHFDSSPIPPIYNENVPHEVVRVSTEETYDLLRILARNHGLLLGISSGAALHAAVNLDTRMENGVIVVILPDSGEKYLSQSFWGTS